ncbi:MAG: DNA repair protein RecN [Xenococcaceae cyanobacterium MO_234.B1]|nr:DNA repair protein RecN [Xenococcaceae cyanobacterium MO_234.B1]
MLVSLRINNFALVDLLELDFAQSLNVLTGETGAGKSIILDAIDAVLGGKVNSRMIRQGSDRAILEVTFEVDSSWEQWLEANQIELLETDCLVCSRELAVGNGRLRSRFRINGVLANRQLMEDLRSRLVEITAQGQTINLLISEKQRDLLDAYGGKSLIQQKQKVVTAYHNYQKAKKTLEKYLQSQQERLQRQDLLEYQIQELAKAELEAPDELEQLEQERERLSHIVELQQLSYQAYQFLYQSETEEPAAADLLARAESAVMEMTEYDGELGSILEMVQSGLAQIVEAGQQLYSYGEGLEAYPERLAEIEARIRLLKQICRKYGPELEDAIALFQQLQEELATLTSGEESLEILEQEYQQTQTELQQACPKLTQLRQKAATKLEKQLVKELKPLGMDKVRFECRLIQCEPNINGADKVVFYFSPNPGEKVQPLAVIASGGEMSRFLLALKACFSGTETSSNTLIFDEIDAGVSGKVAQAIAEKLHQLSKQHQILCVTHQPLVAAMADAHYKVEKTIIENSSTAKQLNGDSHIPDIRTVVRVKPLIEHQLRIEEIAQITGGNSAADAIAFAESLLTKANNYRASDKNS